MTDKKVKELMDCLEDLETILEPVTLGFMNNLWNGSSAAKLRPYGPENWASLQENINVLRKALINHVTKK